MPMVRGWPMLKPSRARPPRSRSNAKRASRAHSCVDRFPDRWAVRYGCLKVFVLGKKAAMDTVIQKRTARSSFEAGRKVGRSREERGEAAGLERKGEVCLTPPPSCWWGTSPYPAAFPKDLVVIGTLAMFGEIEPFALGFFAWAKADGEFERVEQSG